MLRVTEKPNHLAGNAAAVLPLHLHAASLAIDSKARQLFVGLTEDQLLWSPGQGRWSIAENLAHLRSTTEVFLPTVDRVLAQSRGRSLKDDGPFTLGLYGRAIVWHLESRPFIRLQAPSAVWPCVSDSAAQELERFLAAQTELRQRMEAANGVHPTAMRFPSPLVSCFRVNLLEFFSAVNAHARRHLRQAGHLHRALCSR